MGAFGGLVIVGLFLGVGLSEFMARAPGALILGWLGGTLGVKFATAIHLKKSGAVR